MQTLRAFIRNHRHVALALLVLAFFIRAAVPAGFMVSASSDIILTVTVCSDASGGLTKMQMVIPSKKQDNDHSDSANKSDQCAFAGLTKVALGGVDAILLALAFVYILILGLAPVRRLPFQQISYLRPPLRGPPAVA